MKERRSLIDGLKVDPELKQLEEAFVFGVKRNIESPDVAPNEVKTMYSTEPIQELARKDSNTVQLEQRILPQMAGRIPVTTRCRPEIASALKRASLQRQLNGIEPYYVQDIMEIAIENWLLANGYAT